MSALHRISQKRASTQGAVVFVHGLEGDAFATWRRNKEDNSFWPKWLADDLAELDVWTLEYKAGASAWSGTAMALPDRATNVVAALVAEGLHKIPLVFVCHSLGGLVVKQLLRQAGDRLGTSEGALLEATRGIVFIATPNAGSDAATWMDRLRLLIAPTLAVNDLEANNPYLRDLEAWYRDHAPSEDIATLSFVEAERTRGLTIVNMNSGDPGILGTRPIPLDADHIGICKPATRDAILYQSIKQFLEKELLFPEGPKPQPILATGPRKLFISYRRRASADARLAQWLVRALGEAGHEVFVDVNMAVGIDWSREIEARVKWCEFMIVLLSEESARSEMVQQEIQLAHSSRGKNGLPSILPVRVAFTGTLDYRMGAILDRYQYVPWQSERDNEFVLKSLLRALDVHSQGVGGAPVFEPLPTGIQSRPSDPVIDTLAITRPASSADPRIIKRPGSAAVQLDDPCYIPRNADGMLLAMADSSEGIIVVKAPRQMGKSSLVLRYLAACNGHNKKTGYVDFNSFGQAELESLGSFLSTLAAEILRIFGIDPQLKRLISTPNELTTFMEDIVFKQRVEMIALALDDIDRIVGTPYQNDVFAMLRGWSNRRASHPQFGWGRFDLVLAVATETSVLIADNEQSPFNVTEPVRLDAFERPVMDEFGRRFGNALGTSDLDKLYELLGGHPFLTRLAFWRLHGNNARMSLIELDQRAPDDDGPFGEHLRAKLAEIGRHPALIDALRELIFRNLQPVPASVFKLQALGLVHSRAGACRVANQLYSRFFFRVLP